MVPTAEVIMRMNKKDDKLIDEVETVFLTLFGVVFVVGMILYVVT